MRKLVLSSIACIFLASAGGATAADVKGPPVAPARVSPSWTGFYLGLNGGFGVSRSNITEIPIDPATTFPAGAGHLIVDPVSARVDPAGLVGGFQLGYNWHLNPTWLLGLEADIQGADIKDSVSAPVNMANFHPLFGNFSATQKIDWFGTVRGRLGYFLHPDWMVYATGGLAYGQVKESANLALTFANTAIAFGVGGFSFACVNAPVGPPPFAGGPVCFDGSHSRTSVGWTAGAGTEFRLTQNMTAKVEYLYVNLGNENFNIPAVTLLGPGNASILRVSFDDAAFHLFRGGLNWRF